MYRARAVDTVPELIHECGAKLRFSENMGGRRGKCPTCGNPVEVPRAPADAAPPPRPGLAPAPRAVLAPAPPPPASPPPPRMHLDPPAGWDEYQAFLEGRGPAPVFRAMPANLMLKTEADKKWEEGKSKAPPSKFQCPGCKARLEVGGLVCTGCGLDLRTGRTLDGKHKLAEGGMRYLAQIPWLSEPGSSAS